MKDLEIIVPIKNEAGNLVNLVSRIDAALTTYRINYGIIFIDDHSTDATNIILRSLSKKYPIKFYSKAGKLGKAYSILEGAGYAQSNNLAMIDGDLQYEPEAIPTMFKKLESNGVVIGKRVYLAKSKVRQIIHSFFKLIFGKLLFGFDVDIQSGLKLFKKEIISQINQTEVSPWTIDLPLLHTAVEMGYTLDEVEVNFYDRTAGQSKINFLQASFAPAISSLKLRLARKKIYKLHPSAPNSMLEAGLIYKKKRFITHTTLPTSFLALKTLLLWQKIALITFIAALVSGLIVNTLLTIQIVLGFLSVVYLIDAVFGFFLVHKSLQSPPEIPFSQSELSKLSDNSLPVYSILCPLYKEVSVLPHFLKSISQLDWPKNKLDIQLLLEKDDEETLQAVSGVSLPPYIRLTVVPDSQPKTKPKACNFGLAQARGDYLVVFDAEDHPDPYQLKKAYLAFQRLPDKVVCLQAKLNYYNPSQNLLTRLFTAEYSLWFDIILPGLQSINTTIPLGGTSNHFRVATLKNFAGWDPFNVTEDCDLGARLFALGYKTAIIDSTTLEEANSKLTNWLRQRSRWIKGYMQTYLVHTRHPLAMAKQQGIHAVIFHLVVGGRISFLLINPILWLMIISYFAFYDLVGPTIQSFYLAPAFYIASLAFVFGNFLYLYSYMIGCAKRGQWELLKYIFLVPFYWLLASCSAVVSLYQLLFKPHYWEKTVHGFHLASRQQVRDIRNNIFADISDFFGETFPKTAGNLNILIFNWRDIKHKWAGGAEIYIHELAKRWVRDGNKVTLFCAGSDSEQINEVIDGVKIIRRGGFFTVYIWAFIYYLFRLRKTHDVVIDCENGIPFFTPFYSLKKKFLLIHHVHQEVFRKSLQAPFSWLALLLEAKLMPWVYRSIQVITVSPSSKEEILRYKLTQTEPIIIYNGVDGDRFTIGEKSAYPLILYLGRLQYYKSLYVLIKAARSILAKVPDAQFIIAGEGEERRSLMQYAQETGVSRHVKFLGWVPEKKKVELLQKAWVFVNPSFMEGWGLTTLEANACGTPAVASNVPGLRDSIVNFKTGLLVPYGDAGRFANQIIRLIQEKDLRERMSAQAVLWSNRFTWDESAREFYLTVFSQVEPEMSAPKVQFALTSLR